MTQEEKTKRIRELNDQFRITGFGGRTVTTRGVYELRLHDYNKLMKKVETYDTFDPEDDPYGEHDFGVIEHEGQRFFFKIDYYAKDDMDRRSEDASDHEQTTRVLTIMRADEY